jgi:DNA-binding transcriptional LysR family regulator
MDINLIRTFLELNRTRHFGQAADNLCITQSAVSARIRQLEEMVGVSLFTRQRNNIDLTPAGMKFLRYADAILNTWSRACQDIAVVDSATIQLSIGGTPSLWDIFLQDWLNDILDKMPDLNVNAEVHHSEVLFRKLLDRALDVIVGFDSLQTTEIEVVELRPVNFILVSSIADQSSEEAFAENYVYVDWGTSFGIRHAQNFPDMRPPRLRVQLGRLALNHILQCGGSAYLAESMVQQMLVQGRLHQVKDAPIISRMTYAGYLPASEKNEIIRKLVASLAA